MAIERQPALIHWNFFLALEEDLERLSRFVDLSGNDSTYSIEIARLLLSACAETDVVLKQLVSRLDSTNQVEKLGEYYPLITNRLANFKQFEVILPKYNLVLRPWRNWQRSKAPIWWSDHNKVKHQRHQFFERATLKNCLNALAGLYSSTLHLYSSEAEQGLLRGQPRLFSPGAMHRGGSLLEGEGIYLRYQGLSG